MTIEEAIQHCIEVAKTTSCEECAEEHLQLAEWLGRLDEKIERERHEGYMLGLSTARYKLRHMTKQEVLNWLNTEIN